MVRSMSWHVSNVNRSAYLEAVPRSVSMTAMRPPIPVAIRKAEQVLPLPAGPVSAARSFAWALAAG